MALGESFEVVRSDIDNAPFIDFAWRNVAGGDQVPQPLRGERLDFVVVRGHANNANTPSPSSTQMQAPITMAAAMPRHVRNESEEEALRPSSSRREERAGGVVPVRQDRVLRCRAGVIT